MTKVDAGTVEAGLVVDVRPVSTPWTAGQQAKFSVQVQNGTARDISGGWTLRFMGNAMLREVLLVANGPAVGASTSWAAPQDVTVVEGRPGARLQDLEPHLEFEFCEVGRDPVWWKVSIGASCFAGGVLAMRPQTVHRKRFRLVLLGPPGCGKSTFMNTVATVLEPKQGQRIVRKVVTLTSGEHVTPGVEQVPLLESLVILDTKGMSKNNWTEQNLRDLVDGVYPDGVSLEEFQKLKPEEYERHKASARARVVDCVVCCVPASYVGGSPTVAVEVEYLTKMLYSVRDRNPFVVVTRVDEEHDELQTANLGSAAAAEKVEEVRRTAAGKLGVPYERVLVSVNYTGDETSFDVDKRTLNSLETLLGWCMDSEKKRLEQVKLKAEEDEYLAATAAAAAATAVRTVANTPPPTALSTTTTTSVAPANTNATASSSGEAKATPSSGTMYRIFFPDVEKHEELEEGLTAEALLDDLRAEGIRGDVELLECNNEGALKRPRRRVTTGAIVSHVRVVTNSHKGSTGM